MSITYGELHPSLRISRESVLHHARKRMASAGQKVPGVGHCFNEIGHRLTLGIQFNNETFLSFFNVMGSGRVHKTETIRAVHNLSNTAKVYGPEATGVCLHSYQFSRQYRGKRIRHPHPSQIKLLPLLQCFAGAEEVLRSPTNQASGKIMRETFWRGPKQTACRQQARTGERSFAGGCEKFCLLTIACSEWPQHTPVSQKR